MRNLAIVAGLEDSGRHDLAADLAWATIKAFIANYSEYLAPSTGAGHGVKRHGWSAAQYIQAVIEHLSGVDYDRIEGRLRVFPGMPRQLVGADARLEVRVKRSAAGGVEIRVPHADGRPPRATDGAGRILPSRTNPAGLLNAVAVELPVARSVSVRFR